METPETQASDVRVSIEEKPKVDRFSYYLGYTDGMRGAFLLGTIALMGSVLILRLRGE